MPLTWKKVNLNTALSVLVPTYFFLSQLCQFDQNTSLFTVWHPIKSETSFVTMKENGVSYHTQFFRSISFPQTNVHFIRSTHNILAVRSPFYTDNMLHSLCVIDFPTEKELVKTLWISVQSLTTAYWEYQDTILSPKRV